MCEFCIKHGEGKKWYLQAKFYEREEVAGGGMGGRGDADFIEKREENAVNRAKQTDKLRASDPDAARKLLIAQLEKMKTWTQIVPIEDVEQILDMSSVIVRHDCPCRKIRGVHNARFCFGINTGRKYLELVAGYPDFLGKFEELSKEEAKKLFREFDRQGLVHVVGAQIGAQTPFIEFICNCDSVYCPGLTVRKRYDIKVFFKAEYVSTIDWEKCNGCRECLKLCSSGAISYSPAVEKCYIDQFKCYGAGVCRSICPTNAITMRDRNAIPALAKEW